MDEIQAAVLRVKLKYLDQWLNDRKQIALHYEARLRKLGLIIPGESLQHLFVIQTPNRQELAKALLEAGVETKVHWHNSLNSIPGPWASEGQFPEADNWSKMVLSLPCYPSLKLHEINYICDIIDNWFENIS